MFKRKLFKRALPVILSVAMIFQSMPATALAAENEMTEVVETTVEDSGSESDAGDEAKEPANEEPEAPAAEQPEASTPAEETKQEEADTPATTTVPEEVSASTEEPKQEETSAPAESTTQEETSASVESTTQEGTSAPVETTTAEEEATDEELQQAEADESNADRFKTELVFDQTEGIYGFEVDDTGEILTYVTDYASDSTAFNSVIEQVKGKIKVKVDGEEKSFGDYLAFSWVQKTEAGDTVLSGLPADAGNYQLKVSVEKVDGLIGEAAPLLIDFRINKAKLKVEVDTEVKPQTVVGDFIGSIKENYTLTDKSDNSYNKDTFVDKIEAEVIEIGRDGSETKVDEQLTFDKQKDYRLKLNVTFKAEAAKNYEPDVQDYWVITVGELAETTVVVTLADSAAEIARDYDEKTPAKIDELVKPTSVKVMYTDTEGNELEITGAEAVPAWYTREQLKLNGSYTSEENAIEDDYIISDGYKYVKCESDPVDAGEYFVIYKYDGDEGHVYNKSVSEPVMVTIRALPVIIVPEEITIAEGMKKADIKTLLTKAGYTIYYANAEGVADTTKKLYTAEELAEKQPDFFGVSYSGDNDNGKIQYYSPVFVLEQRFTKEPAKEGEEPKVGNWVSFEGEVKNGACEYDGEKGTMEYRIRFTGKKVVYDKAGNVENDMADVTDTTTNSAEKNHVARADKETLDKNAVLLKVTAAAKTEINTEAIRQAFKGAENQTGDGSLENPLWKIYNGAPLYSNRAEYKKAKISGAAAEPASTDESIQYTWAYLSLDDYTKTKQDYAKLSAENKEKYDGFEDYLNDNKRWNPLSHDGLGETNNIDGSIVKEDEYKENIVDAKVYRLHIAYEDKEHKNLPAETDVYFRVERMEVLAVADKQRAEYGDSVNDFTNKDFTLYMLPNNVEPEKREDLDKLPKFEIVNEEMGVDFIRLELEDSLKWTIRRLEKDANGADISGQYIDLNGADTFKKLENAPSQYKYSAYVTFEKQGMTAEWVDWESIHTLHDPFGWRMSWDNFTNIDQAKTLADGEGKTHYHSWEGDIEFNGENQLRVVVDQSKMPVDKTYDGEPVAIDSGLVKIYDGETDKTEELLNAAGGYNPERVNVEWVWEDKENSSFEKRYVTEPYYGGTYTLRVSFNGNETYKSFDSEADAGQDNSNDKVLGEGYSFKITPLDITITPVVNLDVTAGEAVNTMISNNIVAKTLDGKDVPAGDQWIFEYLTDQVYDLEEDNYISYTGYALLKGYYYGEDDEVYYSLFNQKVYKDNEELKQDEDYVYLLKFGNKYTVKVQPESGVRFPYNTSYNITYKYSEAVDPKRGASWIGKWNTDLIETIETTDGVNTHIITPRQAIPFIYENYLHDEESDMYDIDGNAIPVDKNYIKYKIYAPKEFAGNTYGNEFDKYSPNFVFKNNIKDAGGYVLEDWQYSGYEDEEDGWIDVYDEYYITVLFPVTKDENTGRNKPVPSFNITWENGYTEKFQLNVTDADGNDIPLEANLKKAVAPKSLAFNGVNTKMVVGDTQPLDVKITKAQLGDVIKINYRLEKQGDNNITSNEYASINPDTGVITALSTSNNKPVKVSVEAYSVYLADDGTLKEITGKGVKVAKTSITISDVTAPVIKKIDKIEDNSARLQFTLPDNGYRREIYVVELKDKADAKNWTKDSFEKAIAGMKNGQWKDTFAIQPIYISGKTDYSAGKKLVVVGDKEIFGKDCILGRDSNYDFEGFKAGMNYAVYVRNVSAARTLADGSKVALSANGSVKSFVMTKAQVKGLYLRFDTVDGESTITRTDDIYEILLSGKSAQLIVDGAFYEKEDSDRPAAEDHDELTFELPIKDRTLLNTYLNPKLSYAVYDAGAEYWWKKTNGEKTDDPWLAENAVQSKYATINNKGKITLKGSGVDGDAPVWVYVKADNGELARVLVHIISKANIVTAKPIKMKVGDTVWLSDYLEYKLDKAKVPGYRSSRIVITPDQIAEAKKNGYEVWKRGGLWTITAVSPNKTPFELNIKDTFGYDETGKPITGEAKVKLTSAQLDPVKSLKAVYADDQRITLNFTHAGSPEAFVIEVKDARNNVVYSKVAYNNINDGLEVIDKYQKASRQNQQKWMLCEYDYEEDMYAPICNKLAYFEKTKTYSYTIDSDKIVRLSSYSISVTPVFRGQKSAKPTVTKAKTTNIPAARDVNLEVRGYRDDVQNILGGCDIEVVNQNSHEYRYINEGYYFASGNTYTLRMDDMSEAASRITDTLTWKSSNTKVASIKANPGSYTASLKAVQKGNTTITVTSKITKKVIARWAISVKSVGNGNDYRGDFEFGGSDREFYQWILPINDPYYEGRLEVLTLTTPLDLSDNYYDHTWISFTAPEFGQYTFSEEIDKVYDSTGKEIGTGNSYTLFLEANQKIYFKTNRTYLSVESTEFDKLTVANNKENGLDVKRNQWVSFTAPEKNYYEFAGVAITEGRKNNQWVSVENGISLDAGETVFVKVNSTGKLYVTYRNAEKTLTTDNKGDDTALKLTFNKPKTGEAQSKYVSFTAPATAKYTFTVKNASKVDYYDLDKQNPLADGDIVFEELAKAAEDAGDTKTFTIEGGNTIAIKVTVNANSFKGDTEVVEPVIFVEQSGTQEVAVAKDITIAAKATEFVSFNVPKTDDTHKYTFTADKAEIYGVRKADGTSLEGYADSTYSLIVPSKGVKAGDTVYLEVKSTDDTTAGSFKVTDTYAEPLTTDEKTISVNDRGEYWYTFTADKAGYYTFGATATENKDTATHSNLTLKAYNEVFGDSGSAEVLTIKELKLGDKLIMKLEVSPVGDNAVSTEVKIHVAPVDITPLSQGKEETVSTTKQNETKYYSFTAAEAGNYDFKWTLSKDKNGDATVGMGKTLTNATSSLTTRELEAGVTYYIKVTQSTEKEVQGTLKVTNVDAQAQTLTSGAAKSFELKENDEAKFRFTVPSDNLLGWAVSVSTTAKDDTTPAPSVRIDSDDDSVSGAGAVIYKETRNWTKEHTCTLTVTAQSAEATGSIKIEPVTSAALGDKLEVTKEKTSSWYQTTVSESGRYHFEPTKNDENCFVETYTYVVRNGKKSLDNLNRSWAGNNESYFEKGDVIYVRAYNDAATEKQTAAIQAPKLLETTELKTDEKKELAVTENGGTVAYYLFTPSKRAAYHFEKTGSVTVKKYLPSKKQGDVNITQSNVTLEAGEIVLVKLTEGSSVTVTEKAEVKALKDSEASGDITIKPGESAYFSYQAYEEGRYTFKGVSDVHVSDVSLSDYDELEHEADSSYKGFYEVYKIEADTETILTVSNTTDKDIKVNVTVSKVVPTELVLDDPKPITVQKGEAAWVTFKAPLNGVYRYKFVSGSPEARINESGAFEEFLQKNVENTKYQNTVTYKVTCETDKEGVTQAEAKVLVTVPKAADVKDGDTIKVDACNIEWYVFTADKAASYSFDVKNDKAQADISLYKEINKATDEVYGAQWLEEGDRLYVRVDNSSNVEAAEYKFTAVGKEPVFNESLTFDTLNTQTIEFIVPETGIYKYTGYSESKEWFRIKVQYQQNNWFYVYNSTDKENPSANNSQLLLKGDKIVLNVTKESGSSESTVRIRGELSKAATVVTDSEEKTYPLEKSGRGNYFTYTAPEDGIYSIASSERFYYGIDTHPETYYYDNELLLTLKKDQTVNLDVYGDSSSDVKLKISKLLITTISTEEQAEPYELASGAAAYYQISATDTAVYMLTLNRIENANNFEFRYYKNNEWQYSSDTFVLEAGDDLLLRVRNTNSDESLTAKYNLKIEKADDIKTITETRGEDCVIEAYKTAYFMFTSDREAWYLTSLNEEDAVNVYVQYEVDGSHQASGYLGKKEIKLNSDSKLLLRVRNDSSSSITVAPTVSGINFVSIGDEGVGGSVSQKEPQYYKYKATTDGNYEIKISGDAEGYYARDYWNTFNKISESTSVWLNADEEIFFKVSSNSMDESSFELTIQQNK